MPRENPDPAPLVLALETYYTVLVKLLVAEATPRRPAAAGWAETLLRTRNADDPFAWYTEAWSAEIAEAIRDIAGKVARYASVPPSSPGADVFGRLYQHLFPQGLRHGLGEYYTPEWLAEHVLDATGYSGSGDGRLLDPACGSGVFLLAAIRRIRRARGGSTEPRELAREILDSVVGFDLNPLAVMTARANYLLAIGDLLGPEPAVEIPVYRRDAILDEAQPGERFDYVVGNPPWIAWEYLPAAYREATAPLWRHYGLFSLSGTEARHGGGKKDLSTLVLYAAADRYLKHGGRLGFVITQTLLQTKGAGDGFRRFRLGVSGEPLGVLRVDDMVRFQPFAGAANWTAAIVLEKGRETTYPVPYVRWTLDGRLPRGGDVPEGCFSRESCTARPIDPARPRSPWLVLPEGTAADVAPRPGPSDYVAHLGANSGGANGVYWVEVLGRRGDGVLVRNLPGRGKRAVEAVECVLEPDLLYPLVRWGDVARYHARPRTWLLLAQDVQSRKGIDEAVMQDRYPRTLAYLTRFREALIARAAYRRYQHRWAFYSMYNVGPYTPAPIKVIWRRMDTRIRAAVVEPIDDAVLGTRPVIAQETCVQLEAGSLAEAHYSITSTCGVSTRKTPSTPRWPKPARRPIVSPPRARP
ncbi:MAG: N-6 DNA methylase [Planctomycetia bacterium]|nr:N-6 DNA methylase [Planctomycetia bacterium]